MDDRRRTLAAIAVIVGFLLFVAIVVGLVISGKKILSPVPEDDAIKIIFISPTVAVSPTSSATATPTPSPKTTATKTPAPTKKPTATATPTITPSPTP